MSDGQDSGQEKTEDPTQKKLQDARKRGDVPSSQEVKSWFVLLSGFLFLLALAPITLPNLIEYLGNYLTNVSKISIDMDSVTTLLIDVFGGMLIILLVPFLLMLIFAVASSVIQTGFLLSFEPVTPKLSKIGLISGFKRLFSGRSLLEFVKGILKILLIGTIMYVVASGSLTNIQGLVGIAAADILARIWQLVILFMIPVLFIMGVVAVADYFYQVFAYRKKLRMTRQEIKDEMKQTEGDPMVKARLRQLRMEKSRQRMMAAVPDADVVVTNPTHFAVAMQYDPILMPAPKVIAKGIDAVALRIRAVAEEHEIIIIENPPLARALYEVVEIDECIPAEHYKAVAEIISYVFKVKRRHMPSDNPQPSPSPN